MAQTIYKLGLEGDQFLNTAKKIQTEIDRLTQRQKDLSKANLKSTDEYQLNSAALKENKTQLNFLTKQIQQNNAQQEETVKVTAEATKIMDKEAKTINELRNQNKELLKIKNNLILTNEDEAKLAKEIDKRLNQNNETLKENSDAYTKQKLNIGNYASALDGLNPRLKGVITSGQDIVTGLKAQKAALVASTSATTLTSKALKVFKLALISTGIGAIVVALGSLVAWLTKTQAGIDLASKVMAGFGAAIDVIIDRAAKVGGAFTKFFQGDFTGGFNELKGAAKGLGDELEREIRLAYELEGILQGVEKAEINLDIRRSAANARLKELNKIIEDTTKTEKERLDAAREFSKIEEGLVAEEVANQEKKVAALLGFKTVTSEVRDIIQQIGQEGVALDQLGISESTISDMEVFRDEVTKLFDVQTRSLEAQTTNQNKYNTIQSSITATRQRAYEERRKISEQEAREDAERLEEIRLAEEEYETEQLDKIRSFEERKRELENEIALQNAATDEEKEALKLEQDFEKQILELERLQLNEEQKTELLTLLEEERGLAIQAIKDKFRKQEQTVSKKTDKAQLKQEKAQAEARANVAATLTGILQGLLGDSIGAKLASIAIEAAIQAGLVAIESSAAQARNYATATALGPPQNIAAIPLAIGQNLAMAANSSAAITKIIAGAALQGVGTLVGGLSSGKKKFAEGGMLRGASHSNGGIKTPFGEMEGGEAVINKRSMRDPFLRSLASEINAAGGGVRFADGGITASSVNSSIPNSESVLGNINEFIDGKINSIRVQNVATDTIEVANGVFEVENQANV